MLRILFLVVLSITTLGAAKDKVGANQNEETFRDIGTEGGIVRGTVINTKEGEYVSYLGIPYAEPPVGVFRFRAPQPPPKWSKIYHANKTVQCAQMGTGYEDCLIVNVFTPTQTSNDALPVLVYIHGGSMIIGYAPTEGVEPLIKHNIIVVTINYRLGVFGFLCFGIEAAPGNVGLKDQVAALKWVRNNIRNFGGDPEQVTIYGMSAGGASVEYQILSSMGKGLFNKAIVESGSATSGWPLEANPIKTAINLAKKLDFSDVTTLKKLVEQYRKVPANKLSAYNFDYYKDAINGEFGFVPCVEKPLNYTDLQTTFITESPFNILSKSEYEKVPMMMIFASIEGLFLRSEEYYTDDYKNRMEARFIEFLPCDLEFDTPEIANAVGQDVKEFYFGAKPIDDDMLKEYLNYFGDHMVLHGLLNSAHAHSKNDNPVYLMEFAYKGKMGSYDKFYDHLDKAGHGDAVKHAILKTNVQNPHDRLMVDRMAKLLANFVKFGNPTPERSKLVPIIWPRVQPENLSCLYVDKQIHVVEEPYWGRKVFWDQLYKKFRRTVLTTDSTG